MINVTKKINQNKGLERWEPFFDGMVREGFNDEATFWAVLSDMQVGATCKLGRRIFQAERSEWSSDMCVSLAGSQSKWSRGESGRRDSRTDSKLRWEAVLRVLIRATVWSDCCFKSLSWLLYREKIQGKRNLFDWYPTQDNLLNSQRIPFIFKDQGHKGHSHFSEFVVILEIL